MSVYTSTGGFNSEHPSTILILAWCWYSLPRVRVYPRVDYRSGRILGHGSGTGMGKIYSCGYGSGRKFLYPQTPICNIKLTQLQIYFAGAMTGVVSW